MIKGSVILGTAQTLCWGVIDFIKDPVSFVRSRFGFENE